MPLEIGTTEKRMARFLDLKDYRQELLLAATGLASCKVNEIRIAPRGSEGVASFSIVLSRKALDNAISETLDEINASLKRLSDEIKAEL